MLITIFVTVYVCFFLSIFQLMNFVEGRIVLILEGGHNLDSISKSILWL